MATYTLHATTCPTASALGAPSAPSANYPGARLHNCVYYAKTLPATVRVTQVEVTVPPPTAKK